MHRPFPAGRVRRAGSFQGVATREDGWVNSSATPFTDGAVVPLRHAVATPRHSAAARWMEDTANATAAPDARPPPSRFTPRPANRRESS